MEYLKDILKEEEIKQFEGLVERSRWLSNLEKDSFLGKTRPHPPAYLIEAAFDAVKEEEDFFKRLKEKVPGVYDYLEQMQVWLDREDKTYSNFPGFPNKFPPGILEPLLPEEKEDTAGKETQHQEKKDAPPSITSTTDEKILIDKKSGAPLKVDQSTLTIPPTKPEKPTNTEHGSQKEPGVKESESIGQIGSSGIDRLSSTSKFIKIQEHRLNFDEDKFLTLLAGSISLTADEKIKIVNSIPKLSQHQVDELIRIFEEEKQKFTELSIKHGDEIKKLEAMHAFEWEHVVCLRFLLDSIGEKVDFSLFYDQVLEIENLFQRYLFNEAIALVKKKIEENPSFVFYYEYYFQGLKIFDSLNLDAVTGILNDNFKELPVDLYDAVLAIFEFEQLYVYGNQRFLEKMEDKELAPGFAFLKPYIMSKYHLYFGEGEDSLNLALSFINEAVGIVGTSDTGTLLFLFHHQVKVLLAMKEFEKIEELLKMILDECLPPYYRYIKLLGTCFRLTSEETDANKSRLKQTSECFIREYAKENNLKDLEESFKETLQKKETEKKGPVKEKFQKEDVEDDDEDVFSFLAEDSEKSSQSHVENGKEGELWDVTRELEDTIKELGFVDTDAQALELKIDRLTGKRKYKQAADLLESELAAGKWSPHGYRLLTYYFDLQRKQDKLYALYPGHKESFLKKPDFKNSLSYYLLVYAMETGYRYEVRDIAAFISRKYYFLPTGFFLTFRNEHYRFAKSRFTPQTEKALSLGLACGISREMFACHAEYYRWTGKNLPGNLFNLLGGSIFRDDFRYCIMCSNRLGWFDIGLAFTIISLHENFMNNNVFNCFAISLEPKKHEKFPLLEAMTAALFYIKAIDTKFEWSGTLLTNKSSSLFYIFRTIKNISNSAFYASLLAVKIDPQQTWLSYGYLLRLAVEEKKESIYLPAFYTAVDYECPDIRDSHREDTRKILEKYLEASAPPLIDYSFAVFLAGTLIDNKSYLIEEKNILDPEGAAFEILEKAAKILETKKQIDFFLGDHAYEVFLTLTARDWFLLYRYPEKSGEERYEKKLAILRELTTVFPLSRQKVDINRVSREKNMKRFIASLNSGRVVSDTAATLEKVKYEAVEIFEKYQHLATIELEQIAANRQVIDSLQQETIQVIIRSLTEIFTGIDEIRQVKLQTDLNLLLRNFDDEEGFAKDLCTIFSHYNIDETTGAKIAAGLKKTIRKFARYFEEKQAIIKDLEQEIKETRIKNGVELFGITRKIHVLEGSVMFESFRKRIRHGWLIASLKDCFARQDLYMDGEEKDISPFMEKILNRIEDDEAKAEIESLLVELKTVFIAIAHKLDKEVLLIKNKEHPNGLLDYSDAHFNLEEFVLNFLITHGLKKETLEAFITQCCELLDKQTLRCFTNIKKYLDTSVFQPLETLNHKIKEAIKKWEAAFQQLPMEYDKLLARLDDVSLEFEKNITIYKTWFDFYRQAVRDFTLPEIVETAEKLVWDINLVEAGKKNILKADIRYEKDIDGLYFKGENFPDLLEVFKILFQNVVYHASARETNRSIDIKIDIAVKKSQQKYTKIAVEFSSTQDVEVDTVTIMEIVKNEEQRRNILLKKKGTGLATIEDILLKLKGAAGHLAAVKWDKRKKRFVVRFEINLKEAGSPVELSKEEILQVTPLEELVAAVKEHSGLKILIVEDQKTKFNALRDIVQDILTDSHVTHTWDVETTCRILLEPPVRFDLIILDMTLPEDPSFDSSLKSLAGLSVLKVMKLRNIHVPTILVTQYSNWSAEAAFNTRVFIENLDRFCSREYTSFYKGTIRFSHTEIEWRDKLKNVIYNLEAAASFYVERGDYAKAVEFFESEWQKSPDDVTLTIKLADAYRYSQSLLKAIDTYNRALEQHPDLPAALEGLALCYAGIGDDRSSEECFNTLKKSYKEQADILREKLLDTKLKTINKKKQELYQNEMMATLGQMASGIAHEFNTPLQAITFIAGSTARFMKKGKMSQEEVEENLERIVDKVNSMVEQVRHIQAWAKDDQLKTGLLDIDTVITNAFRFFDKQLEVRSIKVNFDFQKGVPKIRANRTRLEQLFINLIQNSRDALEPVKDRKKEITVMTRYIRGDCPVVCIYFEDSGIGFEGIDKNKIFEPFFTTKEPGKGMGLGLAIIKEVVSELGGTIALFEESKIGVTFIIKIPIDVTGGNNAKKQYSNSRR